MADVLSTARGTGSADVSQSEVLVTAYSLHVLRGNSSMDTLIISALVIALTAQVHGDVGAGPEVQVVQVPAHHTGSPGGAQDGQLDEETQASRRLHGRSIATRSDSLTAGVIVGHVTPRQRMVLEDRLVDVSVVRLVCKAANKELQGSGMRILSLAPGLVVPSVLLTISCKSTEYLCGNDSVQWGSVVHGAAESQHLQQPDDVWVFDAGTSGLTPVSEDFESVRVKQQHSPPWHALMLWGAATLAAVLAAVALYSSLSHKLWRQPRTKMWEGYSAVGGPAGAVSEAMATSTSPLSLSDVSPLAGCSARMRLTRNSSVVEYYRAMTGPMAPVESTWPGNSGRRSSLMCPALVCCGVDDELYGTATMPSLPSGGSFDSQQARGGAGYETTQPSCL